MYPWKYTYTNSSSSANGKAIHFKEGDRVQLASAEQVKTYPREVRKWYRDTVPEKYLGICTYITHKEEPGDYSDGYYKLACFDTENSPLFFDQDLALIIEPAKPLSQSGSLPDI